MYPASAVLSPPEDMRSGVALMLNKQNLPTVHVAPLKPAGYELRPGQTLDDRFVIAEIISRSGMATIFKATDLHTGQYVALKVPHIQYESDPRFYTCFVREEKIGMQLNHPYIVKFIPVEHRSRPYIATEYLQGNTLAALIEGSHLMPEKDAVHLASQMCEALTHMHEHSVIHRDLKPQNVMLCSDNTIRILDFGIAKSLGRRIPFLRVTPSKGTPEYMSPEHVMDTYEDARTDIYSLGVMLYQMVTGVVPFTGENGDEFVDVNARVTGDPVAPRALNRELSEQVEEIVLHAMERDLNKRYPTAAAMKADLDHTDEVQLTGRCHRLRKPSRLKQHWKSGLLLGITLTAIVIGFIQLIFLIVRRGP